MLRLDYPSRALVGDWLRAFCGLAIAVGLMVKVPWNVWTVPLLFGFLLLFLWYGKYTLERQLQRVGISDEGLLVDDWRRRPLPWSSLERLRLRFYGTRRQHRQQQGGDDPSGGFLELKLEADGRRVTLDSALPGFALVAWRAAKALRDAGRPFDPVTAGNLLTLGVDPDKDTAPPEMASEWAEATAQL